MSTIKEEVVLALDGKDVELFEYLPYLLQDFREIGTSSELVLELIKKHSILTDNNTVIDLGCGKGAVSIDIAKVYNNVQVVGIDAMEPFIREAINEVSNNNITNCRFEVGDVKNKIKGFSDIDLIILGAVGPIIGNYSETLKALKKCLKPSGYLIIDDGYIKDGIDYQHPRCETHSSIIAAFREMNHEIMEEILHESEEISQVNDGDLQSIKARAEELKTKHPTKAKIFDDYVSAQEMEYQAMSNEIQCVVWVLKSK